MEWHPQVHSWCPRAGVPAPLHADVGVHNGKYMVITKCDEGKKNRMLKARKLTSRTNELLNAVKIDAVKNDIEEKIRILKFAMS